MEARLGASTTRCGLRLIGLAAIPGSGVSANVFLAGDQTQTQLAQTSPWIGALFLIGQKKPPVQAGG